MLKLLENIVKFMGFKNLGVIRIFIILLIGWLLFMAGLVLNDFNGFITNLDTAIPFIFGIPIGFIISVRILKELYSGAITKIFKWVREGFKKGYDV